MKNQIENVIAPVVQAEAVLSQSEELPDIFAMTLQACDLRAPTGASGCEIHIPIWAKHILPEFWGLPDKFSYVQDLHQPHLRARPLTVELPDRKKYDAKLVEAPELRLETTNEPLGLKEPGELLMFVRAPDSGADFLLQVVRKNEPSYRQLLRRLQKHENVFASHWRFGYLDIRFNPFLLRRLDWVVVDNRKRPPCEKLFAQKSEAIAECKAIELSGGRAELVSYLETVPDWFVKCRTKIISQ